MTNKDGGKPARTGRLRSTASIFWETMKSWNKDNAAFLAAGLSYFAVFSLVPLLILAMALAGRLFGEAAAEGAVVQQLTGVVGARAAEAVQDLLASVRKSNAETATFFGAVLLFFAAARVFSQLRTALNMIWGVDSSPRRSGLRWSLWSQARRRLLSFAMVLCVGAALVLFFLVDAAAGVAWSVFGDRLPALWQAHALRLMNLGVSVILLTFLAAMIYRLLPDTNIRWRDVWVGAAVTSLLMAVGRSLIGLYFQFSDVASAFGAAGSVVVVFVGIYLSAMIFLFGAEFTWVYAHRRGSRATAGALPEKSPAVPSQGR
ncbi:MAG: YihY/virulence factor BrkB family protein [Elusimicrobiota bacterium]